MSFGKSSKLFSGPRHLSCKIPNLAAENWWWLLGPKNKDIIFIDCLSLFSLVTFLYNECVLSCAIFLVFSGLKWHILVTQSPKYTQLKRLQTSYHLCTWLPNPYIYCCCSHYCQLLHFIFHPLLIESLLLWSMIQ